MTTEVLRSWKCRWGTLRAAALLTVARLLVRFIRFGWIRSTLGEQVEPRELPGGPPISPVSRDRARFLAGRVRRAALRLPGESRCLPQAMALHWMLGRERIASRLVVGMHRTDRAQEHGFHAWVEQGDVMVIGACDRNRYHIVMAFDLARDPAARFALTQP